MCPSSKYCHINMFLRIFQINMILFTHNYVANFALITQTNEVTDICDRHFYSKPSCSDQITHFKCECDVGYEWNGIECVSTALNSYFDFVDELPIRYLYIEKTFPQLKQFTITFWIRIHNFEHIQSKSRTIFTYSFGENANALRFKISEIIQAKSDKHTKIKSQIEIFNNICIFITQYSYNGNYKWINFAITWNSTAGEIKIFINGQYTSSCLNIGKSHVLERAGLFVLGQSHKISNDNGTSDSLSNKNEKTFQFDERDAFVGSLFNFNVWDYILDSNDILAIYNDCGLNYCGNAVQWSDLREGIRGDLKIVWQTTTGVFENSACYSEKYLIQRCNNYCFKSIGAVCREEIQNNIKWPLTVANKTAKIACKSLNKSENKSNIRYAYRNCAYYESNYESNSEDIEKYLGIWQQANIDECVDNDLKLLKNDVYVFHTTDNFDETEILNYANNTYHLTNELFKNPNRSIHDISYIIDTLYYLLNAQNQVIKRNLDLFFYLNYANDEDTNEFSEIFLSIINALISHSNDELWSYSLPVGSEAIRLIKLIKDFALTMYDFQRLHNLNNKDIAKTTSVYSNNALNENMYDVLEVKLSHLIWRQQLLYETKIDLNFKFPEKFEQIKAKQVNEIEFYNTTNVKNSKKFKSKEKLSSTTVYSEIDNPSSSSSGSLAAGNFMGQLIFNKNKIIAYKNQNNKNKDYYGLVSIYYSGIEKLLPNHNKSFRANDNNINSIIITVDLIFKDKFIPINETIFNSTFEKPITLVFNYSNNFNISDTRCVKLEDATDKKSCFKWSRESCKIGQKSSVTTICECTTLGTFSITNDLYDPNWSPVILVNIPLEIISYVGCVFVILCGCVTLACLFHFKAKSATTSIHKNLCIAVSLSQVSYMISLTNYDFDKAVCRPFALINHYLLFAVFAWLMNEAFNLYITITYAAHQSGPVTDAAPQWRFYLLGWILPIILVAVLLAVKSDSYYAKKICWFNLDHLWIFVSPSIVMILVSMLVLIISAKEHREISYTKNEKANKLIINHMKAVWSQIVLLTISWSFSFMSLIIYGAVIKYLQSFLNCLQGLFLFIFYFLLNEEVRKSLRDKKRQRKLEIKRLNSLVKEKFYSNNNDNNNNNDNSQVEIVTKDTEVVYKDNLIKTEIDQIVVIENKYCNLLSDVKNTGESDGKLKRNSSLNSSTGKSVKFEKFQEKSANIRTPLLNARKSLIIKNHKNERADYEGNRYELKCIDDEERNPVRTPISTRLDLYNQATIFENKNLSYLNSSNLQKEPKYDTLDNRGAIDENVVIVNDEANNEILWPISNKYKRNKKSSSNKQLVSKEEKITVL